MKDWRSEQDSDLALSWLVAAPSFLRFLIVEFRLAVLYAIYAGALVPLLTGDHARESAQLRATRSS